MPVFCIIPNVIRLKTPGLVVLPFILISLFSPSSVCLMLLGAASSTTTITVPVFIVFIFLAILFAVNRNHEDELNSVRERYEKQVGRLLFFFIVF
ncbi:unnamed protein product [Gongylonema pulchrum]|uniref:Aa_trans domain-containing protein n=1 Tax=Gongylonema pulchrum TaxID=637853 RepID=A0A183DC28_9BILA|nr:unnamed protein product [Gongylonema pulchrum]